MQSVLGASRPQDVEECVADAFIRLWQRGDYTAQAGTLKAYLCGIARNAAIDPPPRDRAAGWGARAAFGRYARAGAGFRGRVFPRTDTTVRFTFRDLVRIYDGGDSPLGRLRHEWTLEIPIRFGHGADRPA